MQVRAKIEEKVNGERVSSYLLGREKNLKPNLEKIITSDGFHITNTKAIVHHVRKFYEDLFKQDVVDSAKQKMFIGTIDKVINQKENDILTTGITETEVQTIVQGMKIGKSPGLDRLPVEFYQVFWQVIKKEFLDVIWYVFSQEFVLKNMKKGVIALIPKEGNLEYLDKWRPITMLNVDYKIITKIIANRIKPFLDLFIAKEQFCGVSGGKSINMFNVLMRDVIYYANDQAMTAALINLDWSKAFDRVNLDYLFCVLTRLGFDDKFVNWIKMLYVNAESSLCINGIISEPFSIKKSVRQGCPLSMVLLIISQEPF